MKFKEWLTISEMGDGHKRFIKEKYPNMPPQVRHELGTNTIVPHLNRIAGSTRQSQVKTADMPTPRSTDPFGNTVDSGQSQQFVVGSGKSNQNQGEYQSAQELFDKNEKIKKFENADWPNKPQVIDLNFNSFISSTQFAILKYEFGFNPDLKAKDKKSAKDNASPAETPTASPAPAPSSGIRSVRRHAERMQDQERLRKERSVEEMEPIIVLQHNGKYELLEGWHRTFNFLLSGAPPEISEAIRNRQIPNLFKINFSDWRTVKINAFVGTPTNQA